jgi:DNA primase
MDAVEDIKSRLSIEDVISRYVELKRAGRNFRGLSPFTNEKTPSFMVSPEKQIWHDFSSAKGGNMFSFVMEMEGVDFKGALELLARQAGVDLGQYDNQASSERAKQKERLYQVLELATKFYQIHFSKNKQALEYILKKRGFSKNTALTFKIGYSPVDEKALSTFLTGKGFSAQEIKRAGLATERGGRTNDMFRGRIMIQLMDSFGRVIGFTARLLADNDKAPKYINTPQTPLYDKSRHVFGLHLAKEAIRKNKYSVVTEGNLDVIASHQAGVHQVVATAGTALTEPQLKALGRFADDVRLAFDQDNAGLQAAERSIPLAAKAGVSLSIITIVGAKDPDELIQKDPKQWSAVIEKPRYALDWLIEHHQKQLDITSARGKRELSDIILPIIRQLNDSVEQDHYITKLAELIKVAPEALRTKLTQKSTTPSRTLKRTPNPAILDTENVERIKAQNQLLAICMMMPEIRPTVEVLKPEMLPEAQGQKLLTALQTSANKDVSKTPTLMDLSDYVKMLVLLYEETYQGLDVVELRYEAARLQRRLVAQYVKTQKATITQQLRDVNNINNDTLLNQAKELDTLLKSTKENNNG